MLSLRLANMKVVLCVLSSLSQHYHISFTLHVHVDKLKEGEGGENRLATYLPPTTHHPPINILNSSNTPHTHKHTHHWA